jgi:glycerol-3-phosphate dehydrogenase
VRPDGLTGGANWYDYQIVHTNRLAIAFAEGCDARGAVLVNYAEAVAPLKENGRIAGMRVRDVLTGPGTDAGRPRPADDQRGGRPRRRDHEDVRRHA